LQLPRPARNWLRKRRPRRRRSSPNVITSVQAPCYHTRVFFVV
jgi:hypothetical protein